MFKQQAVWNLKCLQHRIWSMMFLSVRAVFKQHSSVHTTQNLNVCKCSSNSVQTTSSLKFQVFPQHRIWSMMFLSVQVVFKQHSSVHTTQNLKYDVSKCLNNSVQTTSSLISSVRTNLKYDVSKCSSNSVQTTSSLKFQVFTQHRIWSV